MNKDVVLATQQSMETFQLIELKNYALGYFTQRANSKTTPNEDSLLIMPGVRNTIIAVADGVGGSPRSYEASNKLLDQLSKIKLEGESLNSLRTQVIDVIEKTNATLIEQSNNPQTTLTLAIIHDDTLKSFQVGDSGLLICGQRGKIKYRTSMHSPVGYAVAAGMISEIDAMYHPNANILDNMVGYGLMKIEIGPPIEIGRFDNILLSTDGLFDNIPPDELIEIIRSGSLEVVMQTLADCCKKHLLSDGLRPFVKDDDISFVLCRRNDTN